MTRFLRAYTRQYDITKGFEVVDVVFLNVDDIVKVSVAKKEIILRVSPNVVSIHSNKPLEEEQVGKWLMGILEQPLGDEN